MNNSLSLNDFNAFFAATHDGKEPFLWQTRLVKQLVNTGRWPEVITIPTGGGKTAVIDIHIFAVAMMAERAKREDGFAIRIPRRLALIVPRRSLVDSQFEHALYIAHLLEKPGDNQVLKQVADALRKLRWKKAPNFGLVPGSPLVVARLRGGIPTPRSWRDDPVAAAVLSCTPEMFGSRLLFRGYGSSKLAWPREAGLLAMDTVAIVDESHLCRQLITTTRRVRTLEGMVEREIKIPKLQVVETTATPVVNATPATNNGEVFCLTEEEVEEEKLKNRLEASKSLEIINYDDPKQLVELLVDKAMECREKLGPTVGIFVNTVSTAIEVSKRLNNKRVEDRKPNVVLICGRLRGYNLEQIKKEYEGLLDLRGNKNADFLVATQSLEVGIDIDLAAAVSELAPVHALIQRAGRVNRLGCRDNARFIVASPKQIVVAAEQDSNGRRPLTKTAPYEKGDLNTAKKWLRKQKRLGLSPKALLNSELPPPVSKRRLYQRLELADSWWLARTSEDLSPEPELELWLDDDLSPDVPEAGVVVRHALPNDTGEAVELLRATMPQDHEVSTAPLGTVQALAKREAQNKIILLVHDDDIDIIGSQDPQRLRPGDIIVIDDKVKAFTQGVVDLNGEEIASDVLEARIPPSRGDVVLRIDNATWPGEAPSVLEKLVEYIENNPSRRTRDAIADIINSYKASHPMVAYAVELLKGPIKSCDVVPFFNDDKLVRVVVVDRRKAVSDDGFRQTWTMNDNPVLLNDHVENVKKRVSSIAESLELVEEKDWLEIVEKHHDDGKDEPRFQIRLGGDGTGNEKPRAKSSGFRTNKQQDSSGLPSYWRHEQLSVLKSYDASDITKLYQHSDIVLRDIVLRLIGTSHGYGRASFPHSSSELLGRLKGGYQEDHAVRLFDEGEWDEIIERTNRCFGVWGCAFLEALIRAADGQISAEGS
jgi:CRISPR-associated endonuclease/helicase Cas3